MIGRIQCTSWYAINKYDTLKITEIMNKRKVNNMVVANTFSFIERIPIGACLEKNRHVGN